MTVMAPNETGVLGTQRVEDRLLKRDVTAVHLVAVQWLNSIRETVVGPAVGKVPNCSRLMQYLGSGVWSLQKCRWRVGDCPSAGQRIVATMLIRPQRSRIEQEPKAPGMSTLVPLSAALKVEQPGNAPK